ncbi:cytochrome c oxidase subunit II [Candidatus Methylacidithermus pantelleriae]|uniref:cytochrome-c oxidase n=1 Tax=Candidatus Methylacidithermus pantelleriae TaxID=2744239 RepID=A0A8J2BQU9_9BACT|nr:hypothetical protein [Candidatus Methylacidithermus pantelleriae]CAF0689633.1 Cytochrome c oxidase subunit 2 [Candidatus Methylacidithermus pantelleriae]
MITKMLGLPPGASEHAGEIDFFLEVVHWFMLILFVFWLSLFLYCLFRFRAKAHPLPSYQGLTSGWPKWVEAMVVGVDALLLVAFAFPLWANRAGSGSFPRASEAVRVRAVAQQFSWLFHYPGPDGKFGRTSPFLIDATNPVGLDKTDPDGADDVVSFNELHLPVGKPVILEITAKDVIHNFDVIEMRIQQDAIPGTTIPIWFKPVREGNYEIACGQLCGAGHTFMRATLKVESETSFDNWMQGLEKLKGS